MLLIKSIELGLPPLPSIPADQPPAFDQVIHVEIIPLGQDNTTANWKQTITAAIPLSTDSFIIDVASLNCRFYRFKHSFRCWDRARGTPVSIVPTDWQEFPASSTLDTLAPPFTLQHVEIAADQDDILESPEREPADDDTAELPPRLT